MMGDTGLLWVDMSKSHHDAIGKDGPTLHEVYEFFDTYLKSIMNRAKDKGYAYDLDIDYMLRLYWAQSGRCAVTATRLDVLDERRAGYGNSSYNPYGPSLDRVDCSKGYIKGNVRLTTSFTNFALRNTGDEVFKEHVSNMVRRIMDSHVMSFRPPEPFSPFSKFEIDGARVRAAIVSHFDSIGSWPNTNAGSSKDLGGLSWRALDYRISRGQVAGMEGYKGLSDIVNTEFHDEIDGDMVRAAVTKYEAKNGYLPHGGNTDNCECLGISWACLNGRLTRGRVKGLEEYKTLSSFLKGEFKSSQSKEAV